MAQGDVEQPQVTESNYGMGRMNGDDGSHQKPMKKREGRPRGPRTGPGGQAPDFPLRIVVPAEMVGAIIGRQGSTIHQITQETRARVDIDRNDRNMVEKTIFIYGQPDNCTEACKRILYVIKQEAANTQRGEPPLKILSHNNLIGRLVGKGGLTIRQIMRDSNTVINVSSISHINSSDLDRVICVKADSIESAVAAEKLISHKLKDSYEADLRDFVHPNVPMFPGMNHMPGMNPMSMFGHNNYGMPPFGYPPMSPPMYNFPPSYGGSGRGQDETTYLFVHKNSVGAIIGTKGSYIRNIIRYSGASIKIAPLDAENSEQMERKVTVIGNAEAQWKAQFLMYEKIRESGFLPGNDDVHLKVEIAIPTFMIGRIIGKKGQNIKELQRVTGSFVKIPKVDDGKNKIKTSVRIIGSFFGVQSAQRRIRAILQHMGASQSLQNSSKSTSPTMENDQHQ